MPLIKVIQAERRILSAAKKAAINSCSIAQAVGKVLAEDIFADRDQPSTDRSSMDGIAISQTSWNKGRREFQIEGIQKAGIAAKTLKKYDRCFEIMTGGVIPKGCDTVIPIECVKIFDHTALVSSNAKVRRFQFIRKQGSEYKRRAKLLNNGIKINGTHIALAASVGKKTVKVFTPKIAVIGTGDELVELNQILKIHQSYRSNAYALEAVLSSHGFTNVTRFHLRDNLPQLIKELKKILIHYEVLILSGGVSMGKFDLVPQALMKLGVKIVFHKISQRPGRPLLFAKRGSTVIFGLPGNPVSTIVCSVRYVVPYLYRACGLQIPSLKVILGQTVKQHSTITLFLPVTFNTKREGLPIELAGSGDYKALTQSSGFVEIPPGQKNIKKGTEVKFYSW